MSFADRNTPKSDSVRQDVTNSSDAAPKRRIASRAALLGAATAFAAGGIFGATNIVPFNSSVANAQAANEQQSKSTQIKPNPSISMPSFADLIERVRGAVVSVRVSSDLVSDNNRNRGQRGPGGFDRNNPMERFFREFGGRQMPFPQQRRRRTSQGSGFIISADGYVVTNNHVVRRASQVKLVLDGGKSVTANVVGRDPKTDLALLKIKEKGPYKYVKLGDKLPRVGDWVIAVGNPFGLGGTVTAGIVSARGRNIGQGPYDDFLQIDAPVNRGNSGGPTFDINGNVVGVNTAIYSPSGGNVGIAFAIPTTTVKAVVEQLRKNGRVSRGYIGVQIQRITGEIADSLGLKGTQGALVAEAQPGTPAEQAGLRSGDVIVAVNGDKVESPRALARRIASFGPDKKVEITYIRDGRERTTTLTLAKLPDQNPRFGSRSPGNGDNQPPRQSSEPKVRYGMTLAPADAVAGAGKEGVVVAEVTPDSPAARKGLRSGDIILEAGGQKVSKPDEVAKAIEKARSDGRKAVLLRVKSGNSTRFVALLTNPSRG